MHKIFAPASPLRPLVEMYMVYRRQVPEGGSMLGPVPVDGQSDLVFNVGDASERAVETAEAADLVRQTVFDGPRTTPMRLCQGRIACCRHAPVPAGRTFCLYGDFGRCSEWRSSGRIGSARGGWGGG